jgi:hypothetical protein
MATGEPADDDPSLRRQRDARCCLEGWVVDDANEELKDGSSEPSGW